MFDVTPACADVAIMDRGTADVVVVPKRKKVAIVGFATNTLHLVPWHDPEFEVWGMNQGYMHCIRRADRWFEMHMPEATADVREPQYLDWLSGKPISLPDGRSIKGCDIPVYMIQQNDQFPTSVRYPIEEAIRYAGRDYFTSSVAFMMALAGIEGFTEVHLYGINLAIGEEYFYEKPNAEWWIGKLEGAGIKVYVPSASALLKQYRRYGYSIDARPAASLKNLLNARCNEYKYKIERLSEDRAITLGALREARLSYLAGTEEMTPEQRLMEYQGRFEKLCEDRAVLIGALKEDEALIQVAEGVDHGADIVLVPPTPEVVKSTNG